MVAHTVQAGPCSDLVNLRGSTSNFWVNDLSFRTSSAICDKEILFSMMVICDFIYNRSQTEGEKQDRIEGVLSCELQLSLTGKDYAIKQHL